MTQEIKYTTLEKIGFTKEQITYLENELTQKEWEQHEIHKRWISVILEMSEILSDWDNVNSQTSLVS